VPFKILTFETQPLNGLFVPTVPPDPIAKAAEPAVIVTVRAVLVCNWPFKNKYSVEPERTNATWYHTPVLRVVVPVMFCDVLVELPTTARSALL
jgi:hypothetical protein